MTIYNNCRDRFDVSTQEQAYKNCNDNCAFLDDAERPACIAGLEGDGKLKNTTPAPESTAPLAPGVIPGVRVTDINKLKTVELVLGVGKSIFGETIRKVDISQIPGISNKEEKTWTGFLEAVLPKGKKITLTRAKELYNIFLGSEVVIMDAAKYDNYDTYMGECKKSTAEVECRKNWMFAHKMPDAEKYDDKDRYVEECKKLGYDFNEANDSWLKKSEDVGDWEYDIVAAGGWVFSSDNGPDYPTARGGFQQPGWKDASGGAVDYRSATGGAQNFGVAEQSLTAAIDQGDESTPGAKMAIIVTQDRRVTKKGSVRSFARIEEELSVTQVNLPRGRKGTNGDTYSLGLGGGGGVKIVGEEQGAGDVKVALTVQPLVVDVNEGTHYRKKNGKEENEVYFRHRFAADASVKLWRDGASVGLRGEVKVPNLLTGRVPVGDGQKKWEDFEASALVFAQWTFGK